MSYTGAIRVKKLLKKQTILFAGGATIAVFGFYMFLRPVIIPVIVHLTAAPGLNAYANEVLGPTNKKLESIGIAFDPNKATCLQDDTWFNSYRFHHYKETVMCQKQSDSRSFVPHDAFVQQWEAAVPGIEKLLGDAGFTQSDIMDCEKYECGTLLDLISSVRGLDNDHGLHGRVSNQEVVYIKQAESNACKVNFSFEGFSHSSIKYLHISERCTSEVRIFGGFDD